MFSPISYAALKKSIQGVAHISFAQELAHAGDDFRRGGHDVFRQ
jgi:hypothetical protein